MLSDFYLDFSWKFRCRHVAFSKRQVCKSFLCKCEKGQGFQTTVLKPQHSQMEGQPIRTSNTSGCLEHPWEGWVWTERCRRGCLIPMQKMPKLHPSLWFNGGAFGATECPDLASPRKKGKQFLQNSSLCNEKRIGKADSEIWALLRWGPRQIWTKLAFCLTPWAYFLTGCANS